MEEIKKQNEIAETAIQMKLASMFEANNDVVSVPKIYIDITDNYESAAVLDEILFWTLPKSRTGKTSLRVKKNGVLWLAVRRSDWWERKRLTERQSDRAIEKLIDMDLVEKDVWNFNGKPTVHLRLKMSNFTKLYTEKLVELARSDEEDNDDLVKDISDLYEMMGFSNLPNGEGTLPNGEGTLPNGEIINSPDSALTQPPARVLFDEEKAGLDWAIASGKPVTQKSVNKQAEIFDREIMIDRELARLPLLWTGFKEQEQDRFRKFIKKQEAEGRKLETWVNWWMSDEQRVANPPWTLGIIMTRWLQGFPKESKKVDAKRDDNDTIMSY